MIRFTKEEFDAHKARLARLKALGTVRTHRLGTPAEVAGVDSRQSSLQPRQGANGGKVEVAPVAVELPPIKVTLRRSKHGAVKTDSADGKFDSKLEARCWMSLRLREKAGEIKGLRRQVRFSLFAPGGEHLGTFKADFVYEEYRAGALLAEPDKWFRVVADAKSAYTRKLPWWQRTKTLMLACHGVTVLELP